MDSTTMKHMGPLIERHAKQVREERRRSAEQKRQAAAQDEAMRAAQANSRTGQWVNALPEPEERVAPRAIIDAHQRAQTAKRSEDKNRCEARKLRKARKRIEAEESSKLREDSSGCTCCLRLPWSKGNSGSSTAVEMNEPSSTVSPAGTSPTDAAPSIPPALNGTPPIPASTGDLSPSHAETSPQNGSSSASPFPQQTGNPQSNDTSSRPPSPPRPQSEPTLINSVDNQFFATDAILICLCLKTTGPPQANSLSAIGISTLDTRDLKPVSEMDDEISRLHAAEIAISTTYAVIGGFNGSRHQELQTDFFFGTKQAVLPTEIRNFILSKLEQTDSKPSANANSVDYPRRNVVVLSYQKEVDEMILGSTGVTIVFFHHAPCVIAHKNIQDAFPKRASAAHEPEGMGNLPALLRVGGIQFGDEDNLENAGNVSNFLMRLFFKNASEFRRNDQQRATYSPLYRQYDWMCKIANLPGPVPAVLDVEAMPASERREKLGRRVRRRVLKYLGKEPEMNENKSLISIVSKHYGSKCREGASKLFCCVAKGNTPDGEAEVEELQDLDGAKGPDGATVAIA